MAGNPCNPAMGLHAVFQEPVTVETREGGGPGTASIMAKCNELAIAYKYR